MALEINHKMPKTKTNLRECPLKNDIKTIILHFFGYRRRARIRKSGLLCSDHRKAVADGKKKSPRGC